GRLRETSGGERIAAPLAVVGATEKLAQAVGNDIVVIGTTVYRKRKVKGHGTVLEPLDIQLHVNPVSLGVGAAAGLFAIGLGGLAWNGIPVIGVAGLNESPVWSDLVSRATKGKAGSKGESSYCAK